MKVRVLISFSDEVNKVIQPEGKVIEMTKNRFDYIMSKNDCLIEPTEEDGPEFPKSVGKGYYELSNGEKVKGKEEASIAQAELEAVLKSQEEALKAQAELDAAVKDEQQ